MTTQRTKIIASLALAAIAIAAGCLGLGDDDDALASTATVEGLSAATRALHEAGLADPYLEVEPTGEVKTFDLYASDFQTINPYGNKEAWVIALSLDPDEPGTVPGPELRVTQGDTVRVTLHSPNNEFPTHTLHWHGIDVPWESDGVPFVTQPIQGPNTNDSYTYEFVARQPGTYWYHCVTSFPADADLGLFGSLIVEPQDPEADLPYDREETLMFHEMDSQMFTGAGWALNENMSTNPDHLPSNPVDAVDSVKDQARTAADLGATVVGGATGEYTIAEGPRDYYPLPSPRYKPNYDLFMINGKSYPDTEPVYIHSGETLRLRMINAGQLHKSIHLHGHHMLVTHNDGYPLPQPHWEDTIDLAPGERRDVYVQGTNPGMWNLHDHSGQSGMGSTTANDYAFPGGMETMLVYDDFEPPGMRDKPQGDDVTAGDLAVHAPSYQYR